LVLSFDASGRVLRCGRYARELTSRLWRLVRGHLQEDLFEAHPHRPQLEQPPSPVHHRAGYLAADVGAAVALDLESAA
jgi:hypothetical protein